MSDYTIDKIYKSRKYVLEIMKENGYDVVKYENFTMKEIETMINQLDMLLIHKNGKQKIYIQYMLSSLNYSKITETIQDLYETPDINNKMVLNNTDILYIITQSNINAALETDLINIWYKESRLIVVEKIDQLQFNIFNIEKVPKHYILTDEERDEFILKYTEKELPEISRFDPVAKALCAKPGQIIKIMRSSPNSIKSPFYRICLNVNSPSLK